MRLVKKDNLLLMWGMGVGWLELVELGLVGWSMELILIWIIYVCMISIVILLDIILVDRILDCSIFIIAIFSQHAAHHTSAIIITTTHCFQSQMNCT